MSGRGSHSDRRASITTTSAWAEHRRGLTHALAGYDHLTAVAAECAASGEPGAADLLAQIVSKRAECAQELADLLAGVRR